MIVPPLDRQEQAATKSPQLPKCQNETTAIAGLSMAEKSVISNVNDNPHIG